MTCSKAKLFVDYRGKASAHHVRNKSWSVNKFIRSLREQKLSWRRIHWKIWGIVNSMACVNCGARFICAALGHCRYHPEKPTFDARSNVGRYVCCKALLLGCDATIPPLTLYNCDGDCLCVLVCLDAQLPLLQRLGVSFRASKRGHRLCSAGS